MRELASVLGRQARTARRDSTGMQEVAERVPWARAVVRDGRVTLNPWSPSLVSGGPGRALLGGLPARGVAVADLCSELRDDGREELIIRWLPDGAASGPARDALLDWAELVGYRRVWLPDEVVDLAGATTRLGRVATTCPTCGSRWDDESAEFWAMVLAQGHFPGQCPICNGSLPEWLPARRDSAGGHEAAGTAPRIAR